MTNVRQSLLLSDEQRHELSDHFHTLDQDGNGFLDLGELKQALDIVGFKIPPWQARQMIDDLERKKVGKTRGLQLRFEEFQKVCADLKLKDVSVTFQQQISKRENLQTLGGVSEASCSEGTRHSARHEEQVAFSDWINANLGHDPDLKHLLPIDNEGKGLYEKVKDGILLRKVINHSCPDTIDERAINKKNLTLYTKHENLTIALNSSQAIGCNIINIDAHDLAKGKPHLVLGLLWRIIRIGLFNQITLEHCPGLVQLILPGEELSELMRLSPENILLRWMLSYHLERAGVNRRISNFTTDVKEPEIYTYLLKQISPPTAGVTIEALREQDMIERAEIMLKQAEKIGCQSFSTSMHVVEGVYKLNVALVANLFNNHPALDKLDEPLEYENLEESREEKTYRNWMNSMGVSPCVNWLYSDLADGLVIFQLYDVIKSGTVEWPKVHQQFSQLKAFMEKLENCNYAVELGKKLKFSLDGIAGQDISEGSRTLTLSSPNTSSGPISSPVKILMEELNIIRKEKERKIAEFENAGRQLRNQIVDKDNLIKSITSKNNELEHEMARLIHELEDSVGKRASLEKQSSMLNEEVSSQARQIRVKDSHIEELQTQVKELMEELNIIRKEKERKIAEGNVTNFATPSKSMYHWHTLPVADLAFSFEGSYLYSGGGECVLVKWNIQMQERSFLPRLGLSNWQIDVAPDNSFVATGHEDNAIRLVSPQNQVVQCFQGLCQGHSWKVLLSDGKVISNPVPTEPIYDPRTQALVLNGKPGHVQFFSLQYDKQLFSLDISGQDYVSRERAIENTVVEKVVLDYRSNWMATVQCRDDCESSIEIVLKFWKRNEKSRTYSLNTTVLLPHNQRVNSLIFHPNEPMVVSTSNDGKFQVWALDDRDETDGNESKSTWQCVTMGFYRNEPAGDADFSEDGSVVAVSFSHAATLWIPDNACLKAILSVPNSDLKRDKISQVKFGIGNCAHLLVTTTETSLNVWNVVSLTIPWQVEMNVCYLTKNPISEIMAVFNKEGDCYFFKPTDPKPIYTFQRATKTPVLASVFVPKKEISAEELEKDSNSPLEDSCLYFVNEKQELMVISSDTEKLIVEVENSHEEITKSEIPDLPRKQFSALLAQSKKSEVEKYESTFRAYQEGNFAKKQFQE